MSITFNHKEQRAYRTHDGLPLPYAWAKDQVKLGNYKEAGECRKH